MRVTLAALQLHSGNAEAPELRSRIEIPRPFELRLGFRQITTLWRVQGLFDGLRGKKHGWGVMERRGFSAPNP